MAQDSPNMTQDGPNKAQEVCLKSLKPIGKSTCLLLDCSLAPRWPKMAEDGRKMAQSGRKMTQDGPNKAPQ